MTVSYGELARRSGSPAATRAVGSAMATNPLPVIVPCHRVVRSGGAIGGFAGARNAIDTKQWLLDPRGSAHAVRGRAMTVLAFDDTGAGRTALLLIHGFTLDRHVWDDVVPDAVGRHQGAVPRPPRLR